MRWEIRHNISATSIERIRKRKTIFCQWNYPEKQRRNQQNSTLKFLTFSWFSLLAITALFLPFIPSTTCLTVDDILDGSVYSNDTAFRIYNDDDDDDTTFPLDDDDYGDDDVNFNISSAAVAPSTDITVGVYYYPWHGKDFHRGTRNDGYLRNQLIEPQFPMLGEYDDTRPEVIAQHFLWSQRARISLWVCSWWGPNRREDNTIRNVILKHTELPKQHKITLLYEGGGRGIRASTNWDTSNVYPDMQYICTTYFSHPNYYRINNKPVIVIYLSRQMYNRGVLKTVLQKMRQAAKDKCNCELYIIGDHVWKSPPSNAAAFYEPFDTPMASLDAVTNYDVYGNVGSTPYTTQAKLDQHYQRQRQWKTFSEGKGVAYIPGVSPGYNDRGVRFANDNPGLSRRLDWNDEEGTLLAAHMVQARQLVHPSVDNLILVNSFNEWHEDTQIEPVAIDPTTRNVVTTNIPTKLTSGLYYETYGNKYLDIIRRATCPSCPPPQEEHYRGIILKRDAFKNLPLPSQVTAAALYYTHETERSAFRNRLSTRQHIVDGDYSSITPDIVSRHLQYSRQANISLWIVEWNGTKTLSDQLLQTQIFNRNDLQTLQISVLYQVRQRVKITNTNWDYSQVKTDLEHLFRNLVSHARYYRIERSPVLFLSLTRWFHSHKQLPTLIQLVRDTAQKVGIPHLYIVGDQVWRTAPVSNIEYPPFALLDAVVNIDVYGNLMDVSGQGEARLDTFYQRQRDWRDAAWKAGCAYIPSVMPGFNKRAWNDAADNQQSPIVSRQLNATAPPGSFFTASLQRARYLVDSALSGLLVVSSFNRFREDTQLEPVVGKSTSLPITLTQSTTYVGYGSLFLEILYENTKPQKNIALATISEEITNVDQILFTPLQCNDNLTLAASSCTTKWSDLFGTKSTYESLVIIECGQCVELGSQFSSSELNLLGGLDVLGILHIRDVTSLVITTPFIRVQGEFHIDAMNPVDGSPNVEINLVDSDVLRMEKIIPTSTNISECGTVGCDPGPKSIFVTGGKVVWHGMPLDVPTWVDLVDVVSSSITSDVVTPQITRPLDCSTTGTLIKKRFSPQTPNIFAKTAETSIEVTGSFGELQQQRSPSGSSNAVSIDVTGIRHCLAASQTYSISLRLRIVKEDGNSDTPSICSVSDGNDGCIVVVLDTMKDTLVGDMVTQPVYRGPSNHQFNYGEWIDIAGTVSLSNEQLDTANVYIGLRIVSRESNTRLELDEFMLQQQQTVACSENDCRDLVPCNGDAGYPSTLPFSGTGGGQPSIRIDDATNNSYWHFEDSGMIWSVASNCIVENAVYELQMKLRSDTSSTSPTSSSEVTVVMYLKSGSVFEKVGVCAENQGEWVECTGFIEIKSDFLDKSSGGFSIQLQRVNGGPFDIDDLSLRFSHMASFVQDIVVPKSIQQNWLPGAQIVVMPHSNALYHQQPSIISAVNDYDSANVIVTLDEAIPNPMIKHEGDSAAKVALLSRNVVVSGGHVTIYHTPSQGQKIHGVQFQEIRFQTGEDDDVAPIHMFKSDSVRGTEITANSIVRSERGCIIIDETNDVVVSDNVAFQTEGNCVVLKTGMETGVVVQKNVVG
ncbi:glycosyl hydrolase family 99 protein [Nitzschia inconspicua]|uniref:Glycosyl hydrolase family 99 protein n=1 Tax=Nitzschia inconspicua TaxID=303405 RepID=A0A9K3LNY2_9STRA|nr:glycosyl hydrolase family 99 protein [Nitzschia inconspicua]